LIRGWRVLGVALGELLKLPLEMIRVAVRLILAAPMAWFLAWLIERQQ
jgi:hypothetical protein